MKKNLFLIGIAILAIGCTKHEEPNSFEEGENVISFKSEEISTRVEDNGTTLQWESNDQVSIISATDNKIGVYDIANTSTGEMSYSSGEEFYTKGENSQTFYGWSPTSLTPSEDTFSLDLSDQGSIKQFIFGESTTSSTTASFIFKPIYTKVVFELKAGFAEVDNLTGATVTLSGANVKGKYNYLSGEFTDQSSETISSTVDVADDGVTASVTFYILETKSMNGSFVVRYDDEEYISTLENKEWAKGTIYKYDVTVGEKPSTMTLADFGTTYTENKLPLSNVWLITDEGDPTTEEFDNLRAMLQGFTTEQITILFPNLTSIPDGALRDNSSLCSFSIPNVTYIGQYAFASCMGLTGDLTIPGNVEEIGSYAFENCSNLDGTLYLQEGVRIIGHKTFNGCNFSGEILFPSSIFFIHETVFTSANLTSLLFTNSVEPPAISGGAFPDQFKSGNECYITIPEGSTQAYLEDNAWKLYNLKEQED